MKNSLDYFRSVEKVRVGGTNLRIEHSGLENLAGLALAVVVAGIVLPIAGIYRLPSLVKAGYEKLTKKIK